ncbi:SulP family inorganic anion transporter [Algoriphagus persicinus]|uniref:SulP family inorganic anion transporter n=1 Tax=Algoriphagus persicinus TaxID=3108754 RepID=UPI003A5CF981
MSQLDQFKSVDGNWVTGALLGLVLLTMLIIWGLPQFTRSIPASLSAILVVYELVPFLKIDTKTVGDFASIQGSFPPFHLPSVPFTLETLQIILPYAAIMAGVGLIESLLTLNFIDEITETSDPSNKEAVAQEIANMLSAEFSGIGGCAMIGQSLINISSGARARLSGIITTVMFLVFLMFGSSVIEQVSKAALTGLMIMVSSGRSNGQVFPHLLRCQKRMYS